MAIVIDASIVAAWSAGAAPLATLDRRLAAAAVAAGVAVLG